MKYAKFSQRVGIEPVREVLQVDSVDLALLNGLWNALTIVYWEEVAWSSGLYPGHYLSARSNSAYRDLCRQLWTDYFKLPLDDLPNDWDVVLRRIREYFVGSAWYSIYDFIEFVSMHFPDTQRNAKFRAIANRVLERELSAYRFVDKQVVRVVDYEEIKAIEEAVATPLSGARLHLRRALELLADRQSPDYRNSIKESISAVESMCRMLGGEGPVSLPRALRALSAKVRVHPALQGAFEKLYGYSSDEEGVRHALLKDDAQVGFEEAKFMLIACSAFVNFVAAKVAPSE